MDTVKLMF